MELLKEIEVTRNRLRNSFGRICKTLVKGYGAQNLSQVWNGELYVQLNLVFTHMSFVLEVMGRQTLENPLDQRGEGQTFLFAGLIKKKFTSGRNFNQIQ